jgi:hypothetical protein
MSASLVDDADVLRRDAGVGRVVRRVQPGFTRMRRTVAAIRIASTCDLREIETMDEVHDVT